MTKVKKEKEIKLYLTRVSMMMILHKMGYSFAEVKIIMNAPTRDYVYRAATSKISGHDAFVRKAIEKINKITGPAR